MRPNFQNLFSRFFLFNLPFLKNFLCYPLFEAGCKSSVVTLSSQTFFLKNFFSLSASKPALQRDGKNRNCFEITKQNFFLFFSLRPFEELPFFDWGCKYRSGFCSGKRIWISREDIVVLLTSFVRLNKCYTRSLLLKFPSLYLPLYPSNRACIQNTKLTKR